MSVEVAVVSVIVVSVVVDVLPLSRVESVELAVSPVTLSVVVEVLSALPELELLSVTV